jgi:hypothetical protein
MMCAGAAETGSTGFNETSCHRKLEAYNDDTDVSTEASDSEFEELETAEEEKARETAVSVAAPRESQSKMNWADLEDSEDESLHAAGPARGRTPFVKEANRSSPDVSSEQKARWADLVDSDPECDAEVQREADDTGSVQSAEMDGGWQVKPARAGKKKRAEAYNQTGSGNGDGKGTAWRKGSRKGAAKGPEDDIAPVSGLDAGRPPSKRWDAAEVKPAKGSGKGDAKGITCRKGSGKGAAKGSEDDQAAKGSGKGDRKGDPDRKGSGMGAAKGHSKGSKGSKGSGHVSNGKQQCQFIVGIEEDKQFRVVRRIIGISGGNMKRIAEQSGAKLRLRGRGSKFLEGEEQKESTDDLMLCVSTQDREGYEKATGLVTELLQGVYNEYRSFCRESGKKEPDLRVRMHEGYREGSR